MSYYQGNDLRKPSGGLKGKHRKKRKYELGRPPVETRLRGKDKVKIVRVRGNNIKVKVKYAAHANVTDPKTGITKKARILRIVEVPANREYTRRNIIVKGAIIETEVGRAKVTSRPGQDGTINAVLI